MRRRRPAGIGAAAGRDPILSTQLSSADLILSTQRICKINDLIKNLMGAMLMKIVILSKGNESHMAKKLVKQLDHKIAIFFI